MRYNKGFSFIEIGIVLLIVGVVSAAAIYTYLEHKKSLYYKEIWAELERIAYKERLFFKKHRFYTPDVCDLDLGLINCDSDGPDNDYRYPDMSIDENEGNYPKRYIMFIAYPLGSNTQYDYDSNLTNFNQPLEERHVYQASAYNAHDKTCYLLRLDTDGHRYAFDYAHNPVNLQNCS